MVSLDRDSPDAPLLALGQTVFWDEPMKAGMAQAVRRTGSNRTFVAGVHDTDYFAKAPSTPKSLGPRFRAMPHNDTTTRGLWSAAGEFSALFGSETVVTRDILSAAGLRFRRLAQERPNFLDEATEAWGWRGIVSLADNPPVSDVPSRELIAELESTLRWALDLSIACLGGADRKEAENKGDELVGLLCDAYALDESGSLADLYERLLPSIFSFAAQSAVEIETTRTSRLLRFNRGTCDQPRFELLNLFLAPETAQEAKSAYDAAVQGSGLYEIARFGTGSVPFDVYVPGKGRGTLRLGNRGLVVNTPVPLFASMKKPVTCVRDLAEVLEARFGPEVAVVGKAVTLIGMLGREFVFVFHEGASSYVKHSQKLHEALAFCEVNPILRIKYDAWGALGCSCSFLRLPEPLRRPFGSDELCAQSFAARWESVASEQTEVLARLKELKRPVDLICHFDSTLGGSWRQLSEEYQRLQGDLQSLRDELAESRARRIELYDERERLKLARRQAEARMSAHFRAKVFERKATQEDLAERERLSDEVKRIAQRQEDLRAELRAAFRHQKDLASAASVRIAHERRRHIEVEAELMRCRVIREAVMASRGLEQAGRRPSSWWFPLISPDGLWFRETVDCAEAYLERLC